MNHSPMNQSQFTQINIISKNTAKQFFFSFPAETTEKLRNFDLLFFQNKPNFPKKSNEHNLF